MKELLSKLPAIHELLRNEQVIEIGERFELTNERLTDYVRLAVDEVRRQVLMDGNIKTNINFKNLIFRKLKALVEKRERPHLCQVINATGVILHTNLGRARLSNKAIRQVIETASSYSNLEFDLGTGERGSRHDLVEDLVKQVTGSEAAMIVNNNAAAVYLILRALAVEKEAIVSRGELVEIGGSFRVSSIMEESGARLIEVGTTNKTHLQDYERAIGEHTAMIMKVHTSNFRIEGFTSSVPVPKLTELKKDRPDLIIYEDLGSGALFDFAQHNIGTEPLVETAITGGADLVSFSGDKLLGGPQAGVIAGRKDLIDQLKRHQLARVLRVDKMTLAAFEATLNAYVSYREEEIPVIRDMLKKETVMKEQAEQFRHGIAENFKVEIIKIQSAVGGGTLPGVELPSIAAAVCHMKYSAEKLREMLRGVETPIIANIKEDKVLIDFRTVAVNEMTALINGFNQLDAENKPTP